MSSNYHIGFYDSAGRVLNPPIEQGSTFELYFNITLPAAIMANFCEGRVVDGALDTGTGLRAQARPSLTQGSPVNFVCTVTKTSNSTLACKITLSSDITANMGVGVGIWDCELYNDDTPPYVLKPLGSANKAKVVGEATK